MVLCRMLGIMPEDVVKRLPVVMNEAAIARPLAAATKGGEGAVVDIMVGISDNVGRERD